MRSSKYNAARLAPLVSSSRSLAEVIRKLGLQPSGGNHRMIAARVRHAGLDISHFKRRASACDALTLETLAPLVRRSRSIAQVLVALGMQPAGGDHRNLSRRIQQLGIDTSHLRGRGWSRGETSETNASVELARRRNRRPDEEVFIENSPVLAGDALTRRLLAMGWKYRCAWCDGTEWRGQPLVLHLDHINGVNNDNRPENLRFLCPNCHSQTTTYGNRRARR